MSLVVIDRSREAGSPWTARLSLHQISISAGSQEAIHTEQHAAVTHAAQGHLLQNSLQKYGRGGTYASTQPGSDTLRNKDAK